MRPTGGYLRAGAITVPLGLALAGFAVAREVHLRGTLKVPAATEPAKPSPEGDWSDTEVAAGKAQCTILLKGLDLEFTYLAPIKHGLCGAAQPIELFGLGSNPKVKIDPPATVNCPMAAMLAKWMSTSVQPLAAASLKSPVVLIHNAASYDCRNRYGDASQKLSEHAKANAIDISTFTTASGVTVAVSNVWGPTLREMLQPPTIVIPSKTAAGGFTTTVEPSAAQAQSDAPDLAAKTHKGSQAIRQARAEEAAKRGLAMPKPATPGGIFIHAIHESACTMFGTVLGPEANDAHKDHLHLDMTLRPGSSFCE